MKKRFCIKTFGCQMNKNDSLIIAQILMKHGLEPAHDQESADIFIVNTCMVRAHAENRALSYISGLRKWRSEKKRVLGVIGCLAQEKANEISKQLEFIDIILGPDTYRRIGDYVSQIFQGNTKIIDTTLSKETYCGIHPLSNKITGFVSIMRGCNNYCSYCVVPYVRGPARSRPAKDICEEIAYLTESGIKDITLLGQNVNEYLQENLDFAHLLDEVAQIPNLFRLRFLTSHPKDFDRSIVRVVKKNKNVCEWFHLPLQSGSNRILELMNRKYTKEKYVELVNHIRQEIPRATITTDIIVGFPTESEDEFWETIEIIKKIKFDDAYMYRYSTRPRTEASRLESLDEEVIKERLSKLIDIQNKIIEENRKEMVGKNFEVLFEGMAKDGASRGKTRGNKDVVVEATISPGDVRHVKIKCVKGHTPVGELIK